jgi:hypothetical protein
VTVFAGAAVGFGLVVLTLAERGLACADLSLCTPYALKGFSNFDYLELRGGD